MLVFLLDAIGAFILSRTLVGRPVLAVLAVMLGLINGFVAATVMSNAMDVFATPDENAANMLASVVLHPLACVALALWFRYRMDKVKRP